MSRALTGKFSPATTAGRGVSISEEGDVMLRTSIAIGILGLALASACGTTVGDTLTGSALGAGGGAAIGSTMGETKKGAAAGAAAGALGGYLAHEHGKDD
jgi:hypothetical protein